MNFKDLLKDLRLSEDFKKFKKEKKDAFLCSAFFIIDEDKKNNKNHLDYYVPSTKETFEFKLESNFQKEKLRDFQEVPERIKEDLDFNFEEIKKIINKKIEEEKIKNKIQKFIFSLQSLNNKNFLIVNLFLSGMILVNFKLSLKNKKILEFEKKNLFDFLRRN